MATRVHTHTHTHTYTHVKRGRQRVRQRERKKQKVSISSYQKPKIIRHTDLSRCCKNATKQRTILHNTLPNSTHYKTLHNTPHNSTNNLCHRDTGWRRLIGSPKLQIIFHKRAIKYRSLLRKMTCKDKGSYESSPPCIVKTITELSRTLLSKCHELYGRNTKTPFIIFRFSMISLLDVCCSVLQCSAVCCIVWQCVAVCCGVLYFVRYKYHG